MKDLESERGRWDRERKDRDVRLDQLASANQHLKL